MPGYLTQFECKPSYTVRMAMPHHCDHFIENEKNRQPNSEVMCHCCGSFSIPAQQNVTRRVLWVTAKPILTPTVADGIDPRGPRRPEPSYNTGRAASSASGMNEKRRQSMYDAINCVERKYDTLNLQFLILHVPRVVQHY